MRSGVVSIFFAILFFFVASEARASQESTPVEMKVKRVMLDPSTKTPTAVVLLENIKEKKVMPIWIGSEEATSIAMELEKVTIPRPNAHDLIRNILQGLGAAVQRVTITDLREDIYYATITLRLKGQEFQIDSQPSDAIAVALRMKAPIYASSQVLSKAKQLPLPEESKNGVHKLLGIQLQELTPDLASLMDLRLQKGVLVADVDLASPAMNAGIQRGDIIVKINDQPVQKVRDVESLLHAEKKGAHIKIELMKKGKPTTVFLNLAS